MGRKNKSHKKKLKNVKMKNAKIQFKKGGFPMTSNERRDKLNEDFNKVLSANHAVMGLYAAIIPTPTELNPHAFKMVGGGGDIFSNTFPEEIRKQITEIHRKFVTDLSVVLFPKEETPAPETKTSEPAQEGAPSCN